MNKLHSLAFYALFTPVVALGASSVMAQQTTGTGQDTDREQRSTQRDQGAQQSDRDQRSTQRDQDKRGAGQYDSKSAEDRKSERDDDESRQERRGYMDSVPASGMQISELMDADVKTSDDKDAGSVTDLIIDEDGQVVGLVIGIGGILGMGEKDVAIGWDDVTKSGTADDRELRIDATLEDLLDAPEFEKRD